MKEEEEEEGDDDRDPYFQLQLPLSLTELIPALQALLGSRRLGQLRVQLLKVLPPAVDGPVALGMNSFQLLHLT